MTYFTTVTSKGTISIPFKIREKLGIKPGMSLQVDYNQQTGNAEIIKPIDLEALRAETAAFLKERGIKPMTDEELDAAIDKASADAAAERYYRSLQ